MTKLAIAAICVFVNVCAWIVWELTKDAVFGWANATIAKNWGVMDLALQESLIANLAPPLLLSMTRARTSSSSPKMPQSLGLLLRSIFLLERVDYVRPHN